MLRNRQLRNMLLIMMVLSIAGAIIVFYINSIAGVISFIIMSLLILCNVWFTFQRYREIEKLSRYLRSISSGNYSLDIRDNEEGELSILKNEIYKVTLMLSKQGEFLKKEKEQLADALSDISHQLKTPLTSMMIMIDLLSDGKLKPDKRIEFTKNIEMQLERMEWLLASLLKLSKIDAGTVTFKKDKIFISELIQKSIEPLLIPIEIKEQELKVEGKADVEFYGDLNWTSEAVINIVKNCIEHTQNGGIISIFYKDNPIYTEICIGDNGNGIDKQDLPYVFKRFYKGKNASDESIGIGLAMARSIIESQNGDISVASHKNRGTQFHIKFYKQIS